MTVRPRVQVQYESVKRTMLGGRRSPAAEWTTFAKGTRADIEPDYVFSAGSWWEGDGEWASLPPAPIVQGRLEELIPEQNTRSRSSASIVFRVTNIPRTDVFICPNSFECSQTRDLYFYGTRSCGVAVTTVARAVQCKIRFDDQQQ